METYFENMEQAQGAVARQRVLRDMKSLVRSSEHLLQATADDVNAKVRDARARVVAALDRSRVLCEHLQEETVAAARKADTTVRAHPYESMGVAFGVGLLIGVLISRR